MERGIDLVGGLSDPLMSISGLITSFKDIEDPTSESKRISDGVSTLLTGLEGSIFEGFLGGFPRSLLAQD